MNAFAIHVYGNTEVQSVKRRLAMGEPSDKVLDDFNANPTSVLVNYITHTKNLARKVAIFELCEGL